MSSEIGGVANALEDYTLFNIAVETMARFFLNSDFHSYIELEEDTKGIYLVVYLYIFQTLDIVRFVFF